MNILFIHNNFPAQFLHVATALADRPEHKIAAIGSGSAEAIRGVRMQKYAMSNTEISAAHPFARRFEVDCRRAEQVLYAANGLKRSGFQPHVVVAHSGWGEALPLREAFPQSRIVTYNELYYRSEGLDVGFDPEFPSPTVDGLVALQLKNVATALSLLESDNGITPTAWQRSSFPEELQRKLTVLHEGVRTSEAAPNSGIQITLNDGKKLTRSSEVVTFVARNLEPLRGYHVFMRALPIILRRRPNAQVLIVGGNGVSYGASPPAGTTWRDHFFKAAAPSIDKSRVYFLGSLPYRQYLEVLQISTAHVYFTYPFVLSWSMLEAMSAGCVVVGSDTGPVQESIDNNNGLKVPFFDHEALADTVVRVLSKPDAFLNMREQARQTILDRYDSTQLTDEWIDFLLT